MSSSSVNSQSPIQSTTPNNPGTESVKPEEIASMGGHSVKKVASDQVEKKIPKPPGKFRQKMKQFSDWLIKPTPAYTQAKSQMPSVRRAAMDLVRQPFSGQQQQGPYQASNLFVSTNNPNTRIYQTSGPIDLSKLGGPVNMIMLPPLPMGVQSQQFVFNFPPVPQFQQPIWAPQHHTPQPQKAVQPQKPPHIYQDAQARLKTQDLRVTERFHVTPKVLEKLDQKSTEYHERLQETTGLDARVSFLKSKDFGKLSKVSSLHQKYLASPLPDKAEPLELKGRTAINNLEEGLRTIDNMFQTGSSYFGKEEKALLKDMRTQMNNERSLLLQVMGDSKAAVKTGGMTWQTATDLKRVGYELTPEVKAGLKQVDPETVQSEDHFFGVGRQNRISKLTIKEGDSTTERLFKPETAIDKSRNSETVEAGQYLDKQRPRYASRNLAAQNLQNLLGLDLLPKMEMATHNGKIGLLMDEAKGKQPFNPKTGVAKDIPLDSKDKPETSAEIQKNLVAAEWLDALCGQQDRHTANYFIDPQSGKVTLIDNDQAFYPGQDKVSQVSSVKSSGEWTPTNPGLPSLIDKSLFDKITTTDSDDVRKSLKGHLKDQEIEATVSRFKQLKEHANKLNEEGKVIASDGWKDWKSPKHKQGVAQFLRLEGNTESYFNTVERLGRTTGVSQKPDVPPVARGSI